MKIQNVQQNNTNFQGLHGNKRILKKLTPEILQKTGIQECADSFEVLVTPKKGCRVPCFFGAICGLFTPLEDLMIQAGKKVEKNKNGTTVLSGATTLQYSLEELKDYKRSLIVEINSMSEDELNISKTLDLEMVQKSFGQSLNSTDFISKAIDYLIDNASNDERQEVIAKLKKLTNIDYNKVDENGISVVEKIFNSEDTELLELLKGKKLNYSRDLDYAYNRIENDRFKKQVNELNFEFVDLEDAIKAFSMRAVEECKYGFKSPLFKMEYNGAKLLHLVKSLKQAWRFQLDFKREYGRYLSEYLW